LYNQSFYDIQNANQEMQNSFTFITFKCNFKQTRNKKKMKSEK